MNRFIFFIISLLFVSIPLFGQNDYEFSTIVNIPNTEVKDQGASGTCWSYSMLSFIESEMIHKGMQSVDLSEMFVVNMCYLDKAEYYVRMHGSFDFTEGGEAHDVICIMKKYGLVPNDVYSGLKKGSFTNNHKELKDSLSGYLKMIVKQEKLQLNWKQKYQSIVDSFLGVVPDSFIYNNKTYTPLSFASEVVNLNDSDYISITSFTHHPFYEQFILESPDNWMFGSYYNVTIDELEQIVDTALYKGYSVFWGADVSEDGFSQINGLMTMPNINAIKNNKSNISDYQIVYSGFNKPIEQLNITQEMRQKAFDNYETTDDHGMHIVGLVKDQYDNLYYKVKNSWGVFGRYNGYFYVTKSYFRYKTVDILLNKNALPMAIREKLKL